MWEDTLLYILKDRGLFVPRHIGGNIEPWESSMEFGANLVNEVTGCGNAVGAGVRAITMATAVRDLGIGI